MIKGISWLFFIQNNHDYRLRIDFFKTIYFQDESNSNTSKPALIIFKCMTEADTTAKSI